MRTKRGMVYVKPVNGRTKNPTCAMDERAESSYSYDILSRCHDYDFLFFSIVLLKYHTYLESALLYKKNQ